MADGFASSDFTPQVEAELASIWNKVKGRVTPLEWQVHAPLIARINQLKREKNAVILAHSYERPEVQDIACKIQSRLKLYGAWFFQLKRDADGRLCLLEVAPRIAGSMALSRAAGPNFPLLSLYEAAGFKLSVAAFDHQMTMGRSLDIRFLYDQPIGALYVDLDDTLILRGSVNPRLAALIFQCRNRDIPVKLITRHTGDLNATLARHRLTDLFDAIIHLPSDLSITKGQHITEPHAVLIDDSFQERDTAYRRYGIRCFDAAGAQCLLDERA